MGVTQITHKGKAVIYVDYRGMTKPEQMITVTEELKKILELYPDKCLVLSNFENSSVGKEFLEYAKVAWLRGGSSRATYLAFLGISGLKDILLKGWENKTGQENIRAFENESEALDWLATK